MSRRICAYRPHRNRKECLFRAEINGNGKRGLSIMIYHFQRCRHRQDLRSDYRRQQAKIAHTDFDLCCDTAALSHSLAFKRAPPA